MNAPPPLTDEDVDKVMKNLRYICDNDIKKFDEILKIFNIYRNELLGLINLVLELLNKKVDESEMIEVERLKRILSILPDDEIFIRNKDKIWFAREYIINKDAEWFVTRDYSNNIKMDSKRTMVETLLRMIKYKYKIITPAEKELCWKKAMNMLECVAKYKKLSGEK